MLNLQEPCRVVIKESEIVDNADEICKDRYVKWIEGELSEGESKAQTGGRELSVEEYLKQVDEAEKMYDGIRNSTTDVKAISENTGIPEWRTKYIKDHVFYNEHIKDYEVGKFDADYDMAKAWERLENGNYVQSDIDLLNHEAFESKFESTFDTNYRTAHDKTVESGRNWIPEGDGE